MAFYEVDVEMEQGGRDMHNIFHVQNLTPGATEQAIATTIFNRWQEHILPILSAACVLVKILVENQGTNNFAEAVPSGVSSGQLGGSVLPPHDSYCIKKTISESGNTGHLFLGGAPLSGVSDGGVIAPATQAAVSLAMTNFATDIQDSGEGLGRCAFMLQTNQASPTPSYFQVDSFDCASYVGVQRRRRF